MNVLFPFLFFTVGNMLTRARVEIWSTGDGSYWGNILLWFEAFVAL